MVPRWEFLEREGVRLACQDFGGRGDPILILHGLAGQASEWSWTADHLRSRFHVLALDARGHGRSEQHPDDVSRSAHVADAELVIEALVGEPVILIGQSLGGITALQVAAKRPDLVRSLVVVEANPEHIDQAAVAAVIDSLRGWPVPFATRDDAVTFFGGPSVTAEAWVSGFRKGRDGYRPSFEIDVMERTLREAAGNSYWEDWAAIGCPILVVTGEKGILPAGAGQAMTEGHPRARLVEIANARHDLHLDRPSDWLGALEQFLAADEGA
jgi:pimeloyl-ACP methyl ester carboxylesterase